MTLGDFFAVEPYAGGPEWLPLTLLIDDDTVLADRVANARAILGGASVDARVAASTVSLGVFARLLAPAFGAVVTTGVLPAYTAESLYWQRVPGGPIPLAADPVEAVRVSPPGGGQYAEIIVAGLVLPVLAAFRRVGVSPVVLIGNVASALGGAAVMVSAARPELADAAWALVASVLDRPPLAGTATIEAGGRSLRRNSCCLFYRVPGGGFCADCVLADRGTLSR